MSDVIHVMPKSKGKGKGNSDLKSRVIVTRIPNAEPYRNKIVDFTALYDGNIDRVKTSLRRNELIVPDSGVLVRSDQHSREETEKQGKKTDVYFMIKMMPTRGVEHATALVHEGIMVKKGLKTLVGKHWYFRLWRRQAPDRYLEPLLQFYKKMNSSKPKGELYLPKGSEVSFHSGKKKFGLRLTRTQKNKDLYAYTESHLTITDWIKAIGDEIFLLEAEAGGIDSGTSRRAVAGRASVRIKTRLAAPLSSSPLPEGHMSPAVEEEEEESSEDEEAVQEVHKRLKAMMVSGDADDLTSNKSGFMHKQNRFGGWSSQPIEFRLEGTQLVYGKKSKKRRVDLCAGEKGCAVDLMEPIAKPPGKFTEAFGFTLYNLPVPAGSQNKVRESINLCCQLEVERQEWVSFIRRVVNVATQRMKVAPKFWAQNASSLKEQWAKRAQRSTSLSSRPSSVPASQPPMMSRASVALKPRSATFDCSQTSFQPPMMSRASVAIKPLNPPLNSLSGAPPPTMSSSATDTSTEAPPPSASASIPEETPAVDSRSENGDGAPKETSTAEADSGAEMPNKDASPSTDATPASASTSTPVETPSVVLPSDNVDGAPKETATAEEGARAAISSTDAAPSTEVTPPSASTSTPVETPSEVLSSENGDEPPKETGTAEGGNGLSGYTTTELPATFKFSRRKHGHADFTGECNGDINALYDLLRGGKVRVPSCGLIAKSQSESAKKSRKVYYYLQKADGDSYFDALCENGRLPMSDSDESD